MINTYSKFYYGHTIDNTNFHIDFQEFGGAALVAEVAIGEYSLTDFCSAVANALTTAGTQTYAVSVNRTTRIITITAPTTTFKLLPATGVNLGATCFDLLGFSADTSYGLTQTATAASGYEYVPQFKLQDYVDFEDQQSAIDGVTKQSTSGKVEAVKFGTKKIMDCNIMFITDIYQTANGPIVNQTNGVSNARDFLVYATTKADLEFIPDKDDAETFSKCLLESTPEDNNGLSFKLKEMYSKGLVGYYESGVLKFRKLT